MGYRFEVWTVRPKSLPKVRRHCSACHESKAFVCSEKFRVNASKKSIDVWLIYRCEACDGTWNYGVIERRSVAEVNAEQLASFHSHCPRTVERVACDLVRLRRAVLDIDVCDDVLVTREVRVCDRTEADTIELVVPISCGIRLDRFLAQQLGLSRSVLEQYRKNGRLRVRQGGHNALRRPIRDGQIIELSTDK